MRLHSNGIIEFDVSIGKKKKIVIKLEAKLVEEKKSRSPAVDKIALRMEKVEKRTYSTGPHIQSVVWNKMEIIKSRKYSTCPHL